jgi:alkyl hydroperoxide reductase subunit AhpC
LEEKKQEVKLEIQLDEDMAQGVYTNLAVVNHNEAEFVIDFIFVQPQAPRAKVRSRIILSPQHAKRFMAAMQDNIGRYEQNFGEIAPAAQHDDEPSGHYH